MRHVYLVTGPPCAGKSTYVAQNAGPNDVVADFDEIARVISPATMWTHSADTAARANREMDRIIGETAAMTDGTAWIIRCAPQAEARARLAQLVGAQHTIVLLPPADLLSERARERPLPRQTQLAITQWREQYTTWPGDEVIPT